VPTKPSPSVAQPTPVSPCQNGGQDSDPTRDDSSSTRSTKAVCSNGENDNSGDDQAGDDEAGDSRDDQAGDNKSGDGRDEQDGENDKGD
jgi:hypothetical protein